MKRLQPYISLLGALIRNLSRLGYDIVRHVIFPGRNQKGNLLSSLFLLFAGLTEQMIGFRQVLLNIPYPFILTHKLPGQEPLYFFWRYGKKWLRQGLLIATWVLFILSSLEWARPDRSSHPASSNPSSTAIQEQGGEFVSSHFSSITKIRSACASCTAPLCNLHLALTGSPGASKSYSGSSSLPFTAKRWLRLCILRV